MEKIVSQDKLRTAGGKPKKESALLAIKDDALLATALGTSKTKDKGMHSDDEEADVLDTLPSSTAPAPVSLRSPTPLLSTGSASFRS